MINKKGHMKMIRAAIHELHSNASAGPATTAPLATDPMAPLPRMDSSNSGRGGLVVDAGLAAGAGAGGTGQGGGRVPSGGAAVGRPRNGSSSLDPAADAAAASGPEAGGRIHSLSDGVDLPGHSHKGTAGTLDAANDGGDGGAGGGMADGLGRASAGEQHGLESKAASQVTDIQYGELQLTQAETGSSDQYGDVVRVRDVRTIDSA